MVYSCLISPIQEKPCDIRLAVPSLYHATWENEG
uniref:Uncharacterized protein n=1 Tax=Rhizophora mucronata TaxID=61149 RepID=A0A2P2PTI1_RHIMU